MGMASRYSSFCQFRVIGNSHDDRMIPMLEIGTGAQLIFCVAGIDGTRHFARASSKNGGRILQGLRMQMAIGRIL